METVDVAVIGAGVMGAASAWALSQAGREAVVLEQFDAGHDRGSSHGATRIFRFAYDEPFYVDLARRALPLWRELEQQSGATLLKTTGGLDFGTPDYLSSSAAALRLAGAQADIVDAAEIRRRFPGVDYGSESALYSPDSGVLAASQCVAAMLEASGFEVRSGTRVMQIHRHEDGVRIQTADGQLRARSVILTAGAWTGPLLETAGIAPPPLQVSREQIFYYSGGEDLPVVIERGAIYRYFLPPAHGAPGAKAGEHGTGERTSADGRSFDIDPEGQARVCDWIESSFPMLDPSPVGAETCLYTSTPDDDFIIDRDGPIVYASPCSGHGFKFAPLIGRILAALVTGGELPDNLQRFAADRFA